MFLVKNLDVTARDGARNRESLYYEDRKQEGIVLRKKYRPGGHTYKGVANQSQGNGKHVRKAGKVSWKKGTGIGNKAVRKG